MTSNDSGGKMLAAALTETRFGACNINLETKYAALIPPRFLLQYIGEASEEADNMLNGSVCFYLMLIWERATSIGNASSSFWKPIVIRSISSTFRSLTCEPKNLANTGATELQVHSDQYINISENNMIKCMKTDTTHLPKGLSASDNTSSGCLTDVRHSRSLLTPILDKSQFSTFNLKSGFTFSIAHEIKGINDLQFYVQLLSASVTQQKTV